MTDSTIRLAAMSDAVERAIELMQTDHIGTHSQGCTCLDSLFAELRGLTARADALAALRREFELRLLMANGDGQRAFDEAWAAIDQGA